MLESDSWPSSSAKEDYDPVAFVYTSNGAPNSKRMRLNIMSPRLSAALEQTNLSSRNPTFILNEVAYSLAHAVTDLNINRSIVLI